MDVFNDPNVLPWLIPAGPLLAFLIITLITNKSKLAPASDQHEYGGHHPDYDGMMVPVVARYSRIVSVVVGMAGVIAALIISWVTLANASQLHHIGQEVLTSSVAWMDTGDTVFHMGVPGRSRHRDYAGHGADRRADDLHLFHRLHGA